MKIKTRQPGNASTDQGSAPDAPMNDSASEGTELAPDNEGAETQNPVQPSLDLPDDAVNLVPYLLEQGKTDEKVLKFVTEELPKQVIDAFNEDWEARSGWMQKRKERLALRNGDLKDKQEPFKNCANLHNPILMKCLLRLVSRVWAEIFVQGQPIFSARASSTLTDEKADIVTKHENWQFSKEIPDFPAHVWRFLMDFFGDGDGIMDSYRDFSKNVNRHEHCGPDNFVYPYVRKTTAPDMSDVPRKTKILFPYKRDLMEMQRLGFYAQVDEVVKKGGSHDIPIDEVVKDAQDAFEGRDRRDNTKDAPYWLLEQHTWAKLPYQEDDAPFRVVVDGRSKRVLGLYSRYYDDPEDRTRFDRENAEYQQYTQAIQQYAVVLQEEQKTLQAIQQPHVPLDEAQAIAEQVQRERPPQPQTPAWMQHDDQGMPKGPEPCRKKVIERFSHAVCIDNPEGSMGLGIGLLLMPHQMAANILLNQFIDAGTLANSNTVVMHDAVKFPKGVHSINPNEVITVKGVPPQDGLDKYFFKFDHQPANSQLMVGVQQQEAAADAISSAPDVLSGSKEGDETFRGMATRVEQATKQLSALAAKAVVALSQVAKNNAMLNFQFLPDSKKIDARDPATGKLAPVEVTRDLYRDEYDILFAADLSFASRATKVSEADDVMGLLTKAMPPPIASMVFKPQIYAAAARKCLVARGMFDMAALVNSDQEIDQRVQAQQMQPPPGAPGPGGPPHAGPLGPPPPSIPSGQPQPTPGSPQTHMPVGTPASAPSVH